MRGRGGGAWPALGVGATCTLEGCRRGLQRRLIFHPAPAPSCPLAVNSVRWAATSHPPASPSAPLVPAHTHRLSPRPVCCPSGRNLWHLPPPPAPSTSSASLARSGAQPGVRGGGPEPPGWGEVGRQGRERSTGAAGRGAAQSPCQQDTGAFPTEGQSPFGQEAVGPELQGGPSLSRWPPQGGASPRHPQGVRGGDPRCLAGPGQPGERTLQMRDR